jgi:hypothetical protein
LIANIYESPFSDDDGSFATTHTVPSVKEPVTSPDDESNKEADGPVNTAVRAVVMLPEASGYEPFTVNTEADTSIPLTFIPGPAIMGAYEADVTELVIKYEAVKANEADSTEPNNTEAVRAYEAVTEVPPEPVMN